LSGGQFDFGAQVPSLFKTVTLLEEQVYRGKTPIGPITRYAGKIPMLDFDAPAAWLLAALMGSQIVGKIPISVFA